LPEFAGIVVHDCLGVILAIQAHHACALLPTSLRELTAGREPSRTNAGSCFHEPISLEMKAEKEEAIEKGHVSLSRYVLEMFDRQYDAIIVQAYEENPPPLSEEKNQGGRKWERFSSSQNVLIYERHQFVNS